MCAGCVQSGLEFGSANALLLTAGVRQTGRRILDRIRPPSDSPAARRARRESEVAAFLEDLDLEPGPILGWPTDEAPPVPGDVPVSLEALQPA